MRTRVASGARYESVYGYSRAVRAGDHVAVSATAAINPDGSVDPDITAQTRRILEIVGTALEEAGATLADVVRTRVFYVDREDTEAIGAVHGEVFGDHPPATGFIVVSGFIDPRWKVEIEADAVVQSSSAS